MYAVVSTGGQQLKMSEGDIVRVEKIAATTGDTVKLDQVRLIAKDDELIVDPNTLKKAKVVCEVLRQGRGKKVRVFKKKRRKNYARTAGHRQAYTELKVREISL